MNQRSAAETYEAMALLIEQIGHPRILAQTGFASLQDTIGERDPATSGQSKFGCLRVPDEDALLFGGGFGAADRMTTRGVRFATTGMHKVGQLAIACDP